MGEFFKGWRRNVGAVTLVTACVLTAGWVRSLSTTDVIMVHTGENTPKALRLRAGWLRSHQGRIQRIASIAVGKYGRPAGGTGFYLWQLPYWSITIPLILISAFLLLVKPDKSMQKKIAEPALRERA